MAKAYRPPHPASVTEQELSVDRAILYRRAVAFVVDPDGVELPTIQGLVDLVGLDVLEVGCGEGRMTFGCAEEARSMLAFDADEELVEAARRSTPRALRDRIRFEVADAAEIELPPAEFDLALFSWSL